VSLQNHREADGKRKRTNRDVRKSALRKGGPGGFQCEKPEKRELAEFQSIFPTKPFETSLDKQG